jgi:phosphoserine phosphatase RsbU/P
MKFKTKLILFNSLSLLFGIALTAGIALFSINGLAQVASREVEKGLGATNDEYFQNLMQASLRRTDGLLQQAVVDTQVLAGVAQYLEDNRERLQPLFGTAGTGRLEYNAAGGWYQNAPGEASVVTVMPYLLDKEGKIKPEVAAAVQQTSLLDLFYPVMRRYGAEKAQISYLGAPDISFARITPWNPNAEGLAKTDPQNYRTRNYWNYLPPGILSTWQRWAAQPDLKNSLAGGTEVVFATPRLDNATNNLITTLFQPVWDANRQKVRGLVSIDLSLDQTAKLVQDLKLAETGFAFLAQANGNVLAVNNAGEKVMGLQARIGTMGGFRGLNRYLHTSSLQPIAKLGLPKDGKLSVQELDLNGKTHVVIMARLSPINFLADPTKPIAPEAWTLGFIVPKAELLATLHNTQRSIQESTTSLIGLMLLGTGLALVIVVGLAFGAAGRMTRALGRLAVGARRLEQGDLGARVEIKTKDEFGKLGLAFNGMATKIERYTHNLEDLVRQRTADLEEANHAITELNKQLETENWRMKAELEVTRQLQQMILPKERELVEAVGLDISGFMEPADDVGGDYYDVICQDGQVKIGIGDVTGHGLESGVLMIMVQAAVRTVLTNGNSGVAAALNQVNRAVYQNVQRMETDKNMTLSLLEYEDGNLRVSGQHEQMIVVRRNGAIELVDTVDLGLPVGLESDISDFIAQSEVRLAVGDVVVLYTDGITEAANAAEQLYGLPRLCQVISLNLAKSAQEIKQSIIADLRAFIGDQKVWDDITLLVLKQKEPETRPMERAEQELIAV